MNVKKVIMFYCLGFLIWLFLISSGFYIFFNADKFASRSLHVYDKIEDLPITGIYLSELSDFQKVYELITHFKYTKYIIWGTTDKEKFYKFCRKNNIISFSNSTTKDISYWKQFLSEKFKAVYPDFGQEEDAYTAAGVSGKYGIEIILRKRDNVFLLELLKYPDN